MSRARFQSETMKPIRFEVVVSILRCHWCGRQTECVLLARRPYGNKGQGSRWQCGFCGREFTLPPLLSQVILDQEDTHA